jgi:hypothetical protein
MSKYSKEQLQAAVGKQVTFKCGNLQTGEEEKLNGILLAVGEALDSKIVAVRIWTEKAGYKITVADCVEAVKG